jgi:ABC-2 type transport system permease protein
MWRNELATLFRRRRTQAMLLALMAVPIAITLVVRFAGGPDDGQGPTFLSQVTQNGVFAVLAGLTVTLPFFLPMAVAVVAGDSVAGEGSLGTLRYILTRPAGRSRLLLSKGLTVAVFCLVATTLVAVAGLITGVIVFPVGRITTLSGDTLPLTDGMLRISLAALLIGVSLLGLAAIGLFISTLTDVPVGAMAGTLGLFILVGVLDALPQTRGLHPWLFTDHWLSYTDLLRTHIQWSDVVRNIELQSLYVAVFGALAWARFTSKDILA